VKQLIGNLFLVLDQLGNVIAGGNTDNTISARIGYFANHAPHKYKATKAYWKALEKWVDFSFYPVDGKRHCEEAYHADAGEQFNPTDNSVWVFFLTLIIALTCIPISIVLYILLGMGIVKPKVIDHTAKIKKRIRQAIRKVEAIEEELIEAGAPKPSDEESVELAEKLEWTANELKKKLAE